MPLKNLNTNAQREPELGVNHLVVDQLNQTFKNLPASDYLDCAPSTLKLSRHTGILFGVPSPEYIKRGRSVVYNKSTLDKWLSQFCEQQNTSSGEC